jgi:hypothetical protein
MPVKTGMHAIVPGQTQEKWHSFGPMFHVKHQSIG